MQWIRVLIECLHIRLLTSTFINKSHDRLHCEWRTLSSWGWRPSTSVTITDTVKSPLSYRIKPPKWLKWASGMGFHRTHMGWCCIQDGNTGQTSSCIDSERTEQSISSSNMRHNCISMDGWHRQALPKSCDVINHTFVFLIHYCFQINLMDYCVNSQSLYTSELNVL